MGSNRTTNVRDLIIWKVRRRRLASLFFQPGWRVWAVAAGEDIVYNCYINPLTGRMDPEEEGKT